MTPSGIEPATFRFAAQHLNHCATAVPGEGGGVGKNYSCPAVRKGTPGLLCYIYWFFWGVLLFADCTN